MKTHSPSPCRRASRRRSLRFETLESRSLLTGQPLITEFLAENHTGLRDEDGDTSDWIEIQNTGNEAVDLAGWHLTDDADDLDRWTFPSRILGAGEYLTLFASGKNRTATGPSDKLHTDFTLNQDGEYLALVRPDGTTIVQRFAPTYPPQRADFSYGTGQRISTAWVAAGATATVHIPANDSLGRTWIGAANNEPFDDSVAAGWLPTSTGIGFDTSVGAPLDSPLNPLGYWSFDDSSNPNLAADQSGHQYDGTIVGAQYTSASNGRSGLAHDRALDFGEAGDGKYVDIVAAASGAFSSATTTNALTVSVWIYGDLDKPAADTVFYASSRANGTGERTANAHVPWSDSVIYWDTGNGGDCCGGASRISVAEPDSSKWEGQWNHYVFVKNGNTKQIWQNGALIAEGMNSNRLATIRSFVIGIGESKQAWDYGGMIDDVALWSTALSAEQIRLLAQGASPIALQSYSTLLGTGSDALRTAMVGQKASAYVRIPFDTDGQPTDSLLLNLKYDDGFVAYVNGQEVARRNAPANVGFNSAAISDRSKPAGLTTESILLSGVGPLLRRGENVLAFQVLNDRVDSPDLLLVPQLLGVGSFGSRYLSPTPSAVNDSGFEDFVDDTTFSVQRGFFTDPFSVAIKSPTPGATIVYTTDGSEPSLTNGTAVPAADVATQPVAAVPISTTTTLRAAAFKTDYRPTNVDTNTYLFVADVARQPARPTGYPNSWGRGGRADYQMDPNVVGKTLPGYSISDALLSVPTISINTARDGLFNLTSGIYTNPDQTGIGWEKPASIELFDPQGIISEQIDAGLRIHGGISRDPNFTPKHSFRLFFREQYGAGKWQYPLFGDQYAAGEFDQIVLKAMSTDSWPVVEWPKNQEGFLRWTRVGATYIRDQWIRDTMIALDRDSAQGRYVHVYLNGLYWGLYDLMERPTSGFQAEHFGGGKDEYDVVHDFAELQAGNLDAWNAMMALARQGLTTDESYQRIQGNNPDGTRNPALEKYLDLDNLIDYMIVHIVSGGDDWPNHNWWAARRRGSDSEGFRFFPWDQEITNSSLMRTRNSWDSVAYERVNTPNTPAYLYDRLRRNPAFRVRFGDRVHALMFNGGLLSPENNQARWLTRQNEVDKAVVAESARWGDFQRKPPYTRETEWLTEMNWMRDSYWPLNHPISLKRFRNVQLYPEVDAPVFQINGVSQHGGSIVPGAILTLTGPGTMYFTLDGDDPRLPDESISPAAREYTGQATPLPQSQLVRARSRDAAGNWSALTSALFSLPIDGLRISEVHYHPAAPSESELIAGQFDRDDFEFIELVNVSAATIDLRQVRFARTSVEGNSHGVEFDFSTGSVSRLNPGERVLVVEDLSAFRARYGDSLPVAGQWSGGRLSNSSEQITLFAGETPIQQFMYRDDWYPETDGDGYSLEIIDAGSIDMNRWNRQDGWRPSAYSGGSPGISTSVPGDSNRDGVFNSSDLVRVFQAGEYEDSIAANSSFEDGDWNGDGEFDTRDLVLAFQFGSYSAAALTGSTTRAKRPAWLATDDKPKRFYFEDIRDSLFVDTPEFDLELLDSIRGDQWENGDASVST